MSRIDLLRALNAAGLQLDTLESGRLIRCKTTEDKGLQKSGWYRLFDDAGLMTCVYGDWRTGLQSTWIGGSKPTPEQRADIKRAGTTGAPTGAGQTMGQESCKADGPME